MRRKRIVVSILSTVGIALLPTPYVPSVQAAGWAENFGKPAVFFCIVISLLLLASVEIALLAIWHWRSTKAVRWAEKALKHTQFYASARTVYFSVTPTFFRRWAGRSRACSFRDILTYSSNEDQRKREIAEIEATARLLQRDSAGYELWSTSSGTWWVPAGESGGLFVVLAEQKRGIYENGENAVRAGDVVLDCGANVGCYTRHALSLGASLVVAVEPAPDGLECLRRNLANDLATGRVILYPKGVWIRDDYLSLSGSGASRRVSEDRSDDSEGLLGVPLTTVDKVVSDLNLTRVDFIKMDIEGAEVPALLGAQRTLCTYRPRLAIAGYHNRHDSEAIPSVVCKAWSGYQLQFGSFYSSGGVRPQAIFFR